jgi:DNA-binding transcriptional ArsR family regulator
MPERPTPDPTSQIALDASLLRALSHPMRTQILALLQRFGPSTATGLAERLGVNTGATSYHLRQLAEHGLVVEDTERGNARDRWWRAAYRGTRIDDVDLVRSEPELATTFMHNIARENTANLFRFIDELPTLPKNWLGSVSMDNYTLHLTPRQLRELMLKLEALVESYRTEPDAARPRGARRVIVHVNGFPQEGQ